MRIALASGVLLLLLLSDYVAAAPVSPVSLNTGETSRRTLPEQSNGTIQAQGGNVTEVNIDALSITQNWQGYYGNITGNIRLDDANNQSFYAWGNTTPSGEVYASRNDTINWPSINCTNSTERATEEVYLNHSASDGDSVTNTFNTTTHPQFFVGNVNIISNSCFSTNVFVNGEAQTSDFYQILLSDVDGNVVYTTIVEADTAGYHNEVVDFQLLVGENNHVGFSSPTTYYFYVELS